MKKYGILISGVLTVIFALVYYYFTYPVLNVTNMQFWMYLLVVFVVFMTLNYFLTLKVRVTELFSGVKYVNRNKRPLLIFVVPVIFLGIILVNFICSPLFNSKSYYERISVDDSSEFTEEIKEVDFNKMPLLDRDSSAKLGDRTMGQLSELVSQFDVSNQYTQINYNDEIIRVTPLEYNGFIKWVTNRKDGIKGYVKVNSTTGDASLVKLKKGMKYVPSALFNENLYRKLQVSYPTKNFDSVNFEIDNEGNPYWVASVVKYTGVGLKRDVVGAVLLDPITGKSKYYDVKDVPKWVDHVYESDLIIEQINDWGKYKNGFLNTIFGQKEVVQSTSGYNYLAQDNDIFLYTGITSVLADESNIGFVLVNMRTKETKFYGVAGATETSAMESAKGQVQQMNYTSTFPLLVNLNGKPTYLISLKDNAGLVKMYAFVDVVDYQKVVVTDSSSGIKKAAENYLAEVSDVSVPMKGKEIEVVVKDLTTVNIDGTTYYYFSDSDEKKYKVSIKVDKNNLPFMKNEDKIRIKFNEGKEINSIVEIIRD